VTLRPHLQFFCRLSLAACGILHDLPRLLFNGKLVIGVAVVVVAIVRAVVAVITAVTLAGRIVARLVRVLQQLPTLSRHCIVFVAT
jgi:hypothetical protein